MPHRPTPPDRPDTGRRGAILSMELVLVLPIFLLLLFATVEFSVLISTRTRLAEIARSAARHMSVSGASPDQVEQRVRTMLGPSLASDCRVRVVHDQTAGSLGNVRIDVPMNRAAPDLLWMVGFGLQGRALSVDAPMVLERDVASVGLRGL